MENKWKIKVVKAKITYHRPIMLATVSKERGKGASPRTLSGAGLMLGESPWHLLGQRTATLCSCHAPTMPSNNDGL